LNHARDSLLRRRYNAAGCSSASRIGSFPSRIADGQSGLMTVVVLDNVSIHHNIDQATLDRWFLEHRTVLYLPLCSPELNLIETVWKHAKYHLRRFVSSTKETIDAELAKLLDALAINLRSIFREHLSFQIYLTSRHRIYASKSLIFAARSNN
jgi:transposase